MKESGMTRAAPVIRSAILIVLLGLLTDSAHGNAYQPSLATGRPVGAECWSTPGRPWMTCYQQANGPFGSGGIPIVGRVETWAPTWPAPPRAPMPSVAPAPGLRMLGWEYPVSSLALYPTVPRPTHVAAIGPEGWYVSEPYTGGSRHRDFDSYQRAAIPEWPPGAFDSGALYR